MEFYNRATNKVWTTDELLAMLEENSEDEEIDAVYIPPEVEKLTDNCNVDIVGECAGEFGKYVAGTF